MKPKELLDKMESEMLKASPETKDIYTAMYQGALKMHQAYLDRQRNYYATHREHNREYQRAYHKARRDKAKEVEK